MEYIIRRAALALLFSVVCIISQAAGFSVSGVVVDSIGEGESFATLRAFSATDSVKPAAMGVADVDGKFTLPLPKAGVYDLKISATGKETIERTFEVTAKQPAADMGTLTAVTASNILGEVQVVAQRPVVVREIDRIGYDVQADQDAKTQTLDEILKRVPLVTVDPDGTIKVKGSTNFKVYKNNRPNHSFSNNAKEIFKAIPASMIKRIEVITDPGAREDAEGTGVILNIVTDEQTVIKGVMGTISTNYSTSSEVPGANLWLTSQINKVTFSFNAGYFAQSMAGGKYSGYTKRYYKESGNEETVTTSLRSRYDGMYLSGDASYELDSLNLFTLELGGFGYQSKYLSESVNSMTAAGNPVYSYRSNSVTDPTRFVDFNGNFNYQHLTRRKGEIYTLSYQIATTTSKNKSATEYTDAVNMPVPYSGTTNDVDQKFLEQTVQADWTRPINEHNKFDVGAKFIHRKNHSISDLSYTGDRDVHSDFSHLTTIGALYTDYRLNLGRFGARAGVRYEYSHLSAKYHDGSNEPFGSDLNDVVPNAAVSWNINDQNSLKLSYGTSIARPGIDYLNPVRVESPLWVSYGNPNLGSARQQSFNFNYGLIGRKVTVDLTAGYTFSNNGIITSQWTDPDNITYSTYANGGRSRIFNSSLFMQWTIGPKTSFMVNANAGYEYQRNPSLGLKSGAWNGFFWGRFQQQLPWKLTVSLDGSYWGGWESLYSKSKTEGIAALNYTLGLRRAFLKDDRLNVSVNVRNPIGPSDRISRTTFLNSGFDGYQQSRSHRRKSVMVSVSWRFGSLNASVKKTQRSISNDDLQGQSRGSSAGGN